MQNKTFKQLLIAILVAICSTIVAFFSSCSSARYNSESFGTTRIYTVDTTLIHHDGNIAIKVK